MIYTLYFRGNELEAMELTLLLTFNECMDLRISLTQRGKQHLCGSSRNGYFPTSKTANRGSNSRNGRG